MRSVETPCVLVTASKMATRSPTRKWSQAVEYHESTIIVHNLECSKKRTKKKRYIYVKRDVNNNKPLIDFGSYRISLSLYFDERTSMLLRDVFYKYQRRFKVKIIYAIYFILKLNFELALLYQSFSVLRQENIDAPSGCFLQISTKIQIIVSERTSMLPRDTSCKYQRRFKSHGLQCIIEEDLDRCPCDLIFNELRNVHLKFRPKWRTSVLEPSQNFLSIKQHFEWSRDITSKFLGRFTTKFAPE
ncbi:hypothetical protein V1478_011394 [Vespula squamosa]|uniref:Uncharacterized protein n=1 Tax=Vespula squamosa TaxID=30214 RepID=A0ABD2AGJ6_VESSQ